MKVNFILKGKNNPTNIVCRFKPSQDHDFACSTGLWIKREDWSIKKQEVKLKASTTNKDIINLKLKELEVAILDKWTNDDLNKETIGGNWLKEVTKNFFGKTITNEEYKIYFLDWIEKFIEEAPKRLYKGNPINIKTIQQYKTTLTKLKAYQNTNKGKNSKLKHKDISLRFRTDFIDYCRSIERLGDNSISGHIKNIKMWCKNIEIDGYPINQQYKHTEFSGIKTETKDVYLTDIEIDKIFAHDFKDNIRLSNTRDLFIIGLRTGLRVSDFLRLEKINLSDKNIVIKTAKTKQNVIIPIHLQISKILDKRNGEFPNTISDQKFNEYVKEVCKAVGLTQKVEGAKNTKIVLKEKTETTPEEAIYRKETGIFEKWELVSSHSCRRSFASNLYGKLPNKDIMAITGHQTEAQFERYVKIEKEEFANRLANHWNGENETESIANPNLKVI